MGKCPVPSDTADTLTDRPFGDVVWFYTHDNNISGHSQLVFAAYSTADPGVIALGSISAVDRYGSVEVLPQRVDQDDQCRVD